MALFVQFVRFYAVDIAEAESGTAQTTVLVNVNGRGA